MVASTAAATAAAVGLVGHQQAGAEAATAAMVPAVPVEAEVERVAAGEETAAVETAGEAAAAEGAVMAGEAAAAEVAGELHQARWEAGVALVALEAAGKTGLG